MCLEMEKLQGDPHEAIFSGSAMSMRSAPTQPYMGCSPSVGEISFALAEHSS